MNLTNLEFGDIVWTNFPFEEDLNIKRRHPALVLKNGKIAVIAAMGTSKIDKYQGPFDYEIKDLKDAGLYKRTVIRIDKQYSVEACDVLSKTGHLSEEDFNGVIETLAYYIRYKEN